MIGYLIGRDFGYWLLLRYGGYVGITEARIKLGQYLFLRHGGKIIIVAQFIPVLRTLAGILAGANRMPWRHFMLANVLGACLWAMFFGIAAYTLGRQVERLAGSVVIRLGHRFASSPHRSCGRFRRGATRRSLRPRPNALCPVRSSCLDAPASPIILS